MKRQYTILLTKLIICSLLIISTSQSSFSQQELQYSIQPSSTTGTEAIVYSLTNATYPGEAYLVAANWTWSGIPGTLRSLVQFDLSGVPSNIIIDSVKLNLTVDSSYSLNPNIGYGNTGYGQNSFTNTNISTLKKVTSPWTPGVVTWNSQPTTSRTDSVILAKSANNFESYSINVTAIVNEWLADPSSNYGFLLKNIDEHYYNTMVFCSSRHPKPSNRPQLLVYYKNGIFIKGLTEINNDQLSSDITLYPNPATNQFSIGTNLNESLTYELYNTLGTQVLSGEINANAINISNLSRGIFLVHVLNQNGNILKVQKLVLK